MKDKSDMFLEKESLSKYSDSGKIVFTKDENPSNMLALSSTRFLLPLNSDDKGDKKREIEISYKKKEKKDTNIDFDIIFEMYEPEDEPVEQSITLKQVNLPKMHKNKDFKINSFEFFKEHVELFFKYDTNSLLEDDYTKDEFIEEYIKLMDKYLR